MPTIAILPIHSSLASKAETLAQHLQLPIATDKHDLFDYFLLVTPDYLGLQKAGAKSHPLFVDFLSGKMTYRRQHASLRHEALARALGLNHRTSPSIVDATAGLARDSFILASLGFDITLLERSKIIYSLVADGIRRAADNQHVAPIVQRLHLVRTDAITWLQNTPEKPEIIYLDPMFPERQKSALVKKEMRIFQEIVGGDEDSETLLQTALACATKRVVVKRPRLAPTLTATQPSFTLTGSSSRFDIYLIQDTHGISTSAD